MLTIEPHFDYRAWRFGVEASPYVYQSSWSTNVSNWVGAAGNAPIWTGTHMLMAKYRY
ncbi:hypothetical protein [Paraburkholderia sediminicola]|uniref:hypothetical protein n=1 Tax=Paraburkholderia sediminicola TaxID=458836 RepID=UPI0038BB8A3F